MSSKPKRHRDELPVELLARSERRKLRARRSRDDELWFGLGMFGLVGWSVAIPTLGGLVIGIAIDTRFESGYSWTLMFLMIGVIVGCLTAWFWIRRQHMEIESERTRSGEEES